MHASGASACCSQGRKESAWTSTPTTGHKREREARSDSQPLFALLEQIRRLKLPTVDAATANRLLGPFVREALKFDERGPLLGIVEQFGWHAAAGAAGAGASAGTRAPGASAGSASGSAGAGEFCRALDLGSFSLLLQKYRYERLQELGSGSYAVVYKARNRETDEVIALKKLRFGFDEQGLPSSTLREISLLKELKHANIVELKDIIYGFGTNNVYVVLECMDCDLRHLLDADRQLEMRQIKSFLRQILLAVNYAHMHCVMHRDLKPQNILVDVSHTNVKVADFGLARSFLPPFKAYTDKVVTLWYRAPELLLGVSSYSTGIDMWSVGCIFAEMLTREPLFRAESEIGLLHKIFEALGTPNDNMWSGVERLAHYRDNYPQWQPKDWAVLVPRLAGDQLGINLLSSMLTYDPEARISAAQALKHPWFEDLGGSGGLGSVPSSSRTVPNPAAAAGPSSGQAARLPNGAAQQGAQAARPPPMPSMLGVSSRAVVGTMQQAVGQIEPQHIAGPVQQALGQLEQAQHSAAQQQQQAHMQQLMHMQQAAVQLQQPQAQLQQLHLQQGQHVMQFPHAPAAAVAAAAVAPASGCRTSQPSCVWASQRPAQHPAAGGATGAAPTPA